MNIKDVLYKTPEMTEERLLKLIKEYMPFLKRYQLKDVQDKHEGTDLEKAILAEWDLIQEKRSTLSRSERDAVSGLVSFALLAMTKDNGRDNSETGGDSSSDTVETV